MKKTKIDPIDINDILGGVETPKKTGSKIPVLNSDITVAGDISNYNKMDKDAKDLKAKMEILKERIVNYVQPKYEQTKGKTTSFKVNGENKEIATVTFKNQFKKLDFNPEYKEIEGFDKLFEETREIKFIDPSDKTIIFLAQKLGADKFKELFETSRKYVAKDDLNEKQFTKINPDLKPLIAQTIALGVK